MEYEWRDRLNLNYICCLGMQQLFLKDGLNTMLVTTKLVLSEVSTKVAARPIKKVAAAFPRPAAAAVCSRFPRQLGFRQNSFPESGSTQTLNWLKCVPF